MKAGSCESMARFFKDFKDESHIIYVNSSRWDNTELGRFMRDLHCKDSKDIQSSVLAQRVFELKETQKGVETMCREDGSDLCRRR